MPIDSEWTLIGRLKCLIDTAEDLQPNGLIQGIGDDCAVFAIDGTRYGLITTDISIENVHFKKNLSAADEIGWKAMTGNISDIAAMGGHPKFAFVSLGVPSWADEQYISSIYSGMIAACKKSGTFIAGGDTSKSSELIINIALYGEVDKKYLVLRSGAHIGDAIYVTGSIGDSRAGLEILLGNGPSGDAFSALVNRHRRPASRIEEVKGILDAFSPTAMIDISDGLISDLGHICEQSSCGFLIDKENLPISDELQKFSLRTGNDPHTFALNSGEEFELLFTSSPKYPDRGIINTIPVTKIGIITKEGFRMNSGGNVIDTKNEGYDHFKV